MSTTAEIIKVVDGQIVQGDELHIFLDAISHQAKQIVVKDRDSCGEAQELVKKGNDAVKSVMLAAEPERVRLQNAKDELLKQRDKICATILSVTAPLEQAARKWVLEEQAAAKREQDRINQLQREETERLNKKIRNPANRIAAPPQHTVAPDVPKVPGTRIVPRYRFEIIDRKKVNRKFWIVDEQAIAKQLREDQDIIKSMKEIGGIRVWVE